MIQPLRCVREASGSSRAAPMALASGDRSPDSPPATPYSYDLHVFTRYHLSYTI